MGAHRDDQAYRRVFAEPPAGAATAAVLEDGARRDLVDPGEVAAERPSEDRGAVRARGDLDDPGEVATMVRRFYADVDQDDLLGPMFNDVAQVDWALHLPKLTAFWSRALFGIQGYAGNPFRAHALVHQRRRFTDAHFQRWLTLFHRTIDAGWVGPNAEAVKEMAVRVAAVHSRNLDNFLPEPPPAPAQSENDPQPARAPSGGQGQLHNVTLAPRNPTGSP